MLISTMHEAMKYLEYLDILLPPSRAAHHLQSVSMSDVQTRVLPLYTVSADLLGRNTGGSHDTLLTTDCWVWATAGNETIAKIEVYNYGEGPYTRAFFWLDGPTNY